MRYVDIDQVVLPTGWQQRATNALNALRTEVDSAGNNAVAHGKAAAGISAARKAAITFGLKVSARQAVWQELATALKTVTNEKCWYSESRNPTADKNVDHFRPKNRVDDDADHEGYWWLAFDSENYRLSSQWCNQRRNEKVGGTSGGKGDRFPLMPNSFRARVETDDWRNEEIQLLDPIDPEDWKLLTFRPDGHPTPAKAQGTPAFDRAATSIEVYHLHCRELVSDRRTLASEIKRIVEDMEALRPNLRNQQSQRLYKNRQKDLLRRIRHSAEYSAAALAYARAEVFKLVAGHQVKREWLEEILNSNP